MSQNEEGKSKAEAPPEATEANEKPVSGELTENELEKVAAGIGMSGSGTKEEITENTGQRVLDS